MSLGVKSIISHFTRAIDSILNVQWTLWKFPHKNSTRVWAIQAKCYVNVNISVFVCFSFTFYFQSISLNRDLFWFSLRKTSDIHFSCEYAHEIPHFHDLLDIRFQLNTNQCISVNLYTFVCILRYLNACVPAYVYKISVNTAFFYIRSVIFIVEM